MVDAVKFLNWLTQPPKGKKARRKWEKDKMQGEIDRLNNLVWTLANKAGGRVELSINDIWRLPSSPRVVIHPAVGKGPLVVEAVKGKNKDA